MNSIRFFRFLMRRAIPLTPVVAMFRLCVTDRISSESIVSTPPAPDARMMLPDAPHRLRISRPVGFDEFLRLFLVLFQAGAKTKGLEIHYELPSMIVALRVRPGETERRFFGA